MRDVYSCPYYEPTYSAGGVSGGPCWTCRDDPAHCPSDPEASAAEGEAASSSPEEDGS